MLIIPLHQPLTLQRFPWVTAALILINCFVFFGLQSRDGVALSEAAREYQRSGLAAEEFPLLAAHLRRWDKAVYADQLEAIDDLQMRAQAMTQINAYDTTFAAARRLLFDPLTPRASVDDDIALYDEYLAATKSQPQLDDAELARMAERWLQGGRLAPAAKIIERLLDPPEPTETARRLALRLALAFFEASDTASFQKIAGRLQARCALSDEAIKLQRLTAG